ncbi:sensor histidine kinase [Flavobacterium sp.]|jgi:LytS/YehU family sensor histidine kinase|uniref:sensor histidine kinase n=1 Tax=Flavobacterium sp. TaxID=239 RepID=UPI0037C0E307
MKLRILYHLAFWGFFTLLFLQQNPKVVLQDFLAWFTILGVSTMVVYTNLYLLFPKFFFTKKYSIYFLLLVLIIGLGALSLKLLLPSGNTSFLTSIFQQFVNLFFFVVITSSLKFLRGFLQKQELLMKLEKEQLKTELSLLKAQVNPHFLFNTLNNLYGLILQNENLQAADITLKLSDLMRYLLESSKTERISLQKEIKFLEDYLVLEKIRLSAQADIRFVVYRLEKDIFVAPLLFIPFVENAFKHGLQSISESSFAHFYLSIQGKDLFFEAVNSVGQNITTPEKSGTGLENLRKRLELLYPEKHLLEVEQNEGIFKVILQISI